MVYGCLFEESSEKCLNKLFISGCSIAERPFFCAEIVVDKNNPCAMVLSENDYYEL